MTRKELAAARADIAEALRPENLKRWQFEALGAEWVRLEVTLPNGDRMAFTVPPSDTAVADVVRSALAAIRAAKMPSRKVREAAADHALPAAYRKDLDLICVLMDQVALAARGSTEQRVRTLISRPLWRRWNVALGHAPDEEPTPWLGAEETRRVYGSETVVVESAEEFAVSYVPTPTL